MAARAIVQPLHKPQWRPGRVTAVCLGCLVLTIFAWLSFLTWLVLNGVQNKNRKAALGLLDYHRLDGSLPSPLDQAAPGEDAGVPAASEMEGLVQAGQNRVEPEPREQHQQPDGHHLRSVHKQKPGPTGKNTTAKFRPPLRPIWLPELVHSVRDNYTGILHDLRSMHPDEDEEWLKDRAEFGTLALCNPYNTWYLCHNDPTCVLSVSCHHREPGDVTFGKMHLASLRFHKERKERKAILKRLVDRMYAEKGRNEEDRTIFVMTLNSGFSFLFANWLCSLENHGIDVETVKRRTLILARDPDSRRFVTSLGFFSPSDEDMNLIAHWTNTRPVSRKAAPLFGQGDHNIINLVFKFAIPLDLLDLGYTVFLQDVDFIWFKDPVPHMLSLCEESECHGAFIQEGRAWGYGRATVGTLRKGGQNVIPELNTGLVLLRNTPETIHFYEILMQGVFLQQWRRRDQLYYNYVMWHEHFAHLKWLALNDEIYVPGKRLHTADLINRPLKDASELYVLHVSDTTNYAAKIKRLRDIGHWYFNNDQCSKPLSLCRSIPTCWASVKDCRECNL